MLKRMLVPLVLVAELAVLGFGKEDGIVQMTDEECAGTFGGCNLASMAKRCNTTIINTCFGAYSCSGSCPYTCAGINTVVPDSNGSPTYTTYVGTVSCGAAGLGLTATQQGCGWLPFSGCVCWGGAATIDCPGTAPVWKNSNCIWVNRQSATRFALFASAL